MRTVFTTDDNREISLSDGDIEKIAETYNWPYEWQVATVLKKQNEQMLEALEMVESTFEHDATELAVFNIVTAAIAAARGKS